MAYEISLGLVGSEMCIRDSFKNNYASLEAAIDAAREANQFGVYFEQPLDMVAVSYTHLTLPTILLV